MSALVAYQSHVQRVAPTVAVSPVRSDNGPASTPASGSPVALGGTPGASTLLALLGRTGLSGPDGTTVADETAATGSPDSAKTKLQQALSTLQNALNGANGSSTPSSQQSEPAAAPAVDDAIQTILGALAPISAETTTPTTAAAVNTDTGGKAVAAAPKPNLDALHRVLAHYTAQSAAASTVVTLVR